MSNKHNKTPPLAKPSFRQVVGSVLAALFGVQKSRHLERDNNQSNAMPYIIVAVVVTVIFVLILAVVAQLASR